MFVKAIEEIQKFTRPVHTIVRHYHNNFIQPGAATLFFVNEDSVAITCKHVLDQLLQEHVINTRFASFKTEKNLQNLQASNNDTDSLTALEKKYHYTSTEAVAQLKNYLVNCTDSAAYDYIPNPNLDIAIIKFKNVNQQFYASHATFLKDSSQIKQGKYLCRFGFPFAEFTNFHYDTSTDDIYFTRSGNMSSPSFPMDGMVTRHVADVQGVVGIELSTPGLRGQSGGPLFDSEGLIYGMQSVTVQYHMGFDEQNIGIISRGKRLDTVNNSFLNVGRCVHVDVIKAFLKQNKIKYYEK